LGDRSTSDGEERIGNIDEVSIFSGAISQELMDNLHSKGITEAIQNPQAEILLPIGNQNLQDQSVSTYPIIGKTPSLEN
jgi:hypothetical protein